MGSFQYGQSDVQFSLRIGPVTLILTLLLGALAGYALSRFQFKLKGPILAVSAARHVNSDSQHTRSAIYYG